MFLNAESVTVLVTVTSIGVEVDEPWKLVDPCLVERIDIGVHPFISLVGRVVPGYRVRRQVTALGSFLIGSSTSIGACWTMAAQG